MNELIDRVATKLQNNQHVDVSNYKQLGLYLLHHLHENQCKNFDDCRDLLKTLERCNLSMIVDNIMPNGRGNRAFVLLFCYNEALVHKAEQRQSEKRDVDSARLDAEFYASINLFCAQARSKRLVANSYDAHITFVKNLITTFSKTVSAQMADNQVWVDQFADIDERFDLELFLDIILQHAIFPKSDARFEAQMVRLILIKNHFFVEKVSLDFGQ